MKKVDACLGYAAGIGVPWVLSGARLYVRLYAVLFIGLLGLMFMVVGARKKPRGEPLPAGGWILAVACTTAWVALASFSAELSKLPLGLVYGLLAAAVIMPPALAVLLVPRPRRLDCPPQFLVVCVLALIVSNHVARPARRYETPRNMVAIEEVADTLDVRGCVAWVHENIRREKSPPTDDAVQTLRRGTAHCGGMANLLHKMLFARGVPARIVHFSGGGDIHTLVEYREGERWMLADPQNNVVGTVSGEDAVIEGSPDAPEIWQGFDRLYIYEPGRGYVEVTEVNKAVFYGGLDGSR